MVGRVRKLEEALHHAIEWAWCSKALEKGLSKVRCKLKESEVLVEGQARTIVDPKVWLTQAIDRMKVMAE